MGKERFDAATASAPGPVGDWNAHLFTFGRHRHLIFVNNVTYYCLIIEDVRKAQLKDLQKLFLSRLIEQLQYDVIILEDDLDSIKRVLPIALSPTNNDKKAIGTMNEYVYTYKVYRTHPSWFDADLKRINNLMNDMLAGAGRDASREYGEPLYDMGNLVKSLLLKSSKTNVSNVN